MKIRNIELAPAGRDKIDWVRPAMPVLAGIEREFAEKRPFAGLRMTISIHLEAKTAYLAHVLRAGGAQVAVTGCNPLSTQDDVAAALAADGFDVYGVTGATMEEYHEHLLGALAHKPHLIVDDGGDLTEILHNERPDLAQSLIAGTEETTTGVHRLHIRESEGKLRFPMMAVNDARCKYLFDNRYGTGQSVWAAILHVTNLVVASKTVVVAGYGWCGRGIAMRAKGMGANVIVTEIDPIKALEASMEGMRVMPMDQAAPLGDLFITTTGCRDVIVGRHFAVMKNNAFLANAGHFNVEVNGEELAAMAVRSYPRRQDIVGYELPDGRTLNLLAEGRLVNLASGNGHPAEIMDMSFSIQALALEYMKDHGRNLPPDVYEVPAAIDDAVSAYKLRGIGMEIDRLTPEQESYLAGWEV